MRSAVRQELFPAAPVFVLPMVGPERLTGMVPSGRFLTTNRLHMVNAVGAVSAGAQHVGGASTRFDGASCLRLDTTSTDTSTTYLDAVALTVCAWIKPAVAFTGTVAARGAGSASFLNRNFTLFASAGDMLVRYFNGTQSRLATTSGVTFPIGVWTHVAGVMQAGTTYGFKNGSQVVSSSTSGNANTNDRLLVVGGLSSNNGETTWDTLFNGDMAHLAIWNRALTHGEVVNHMAATSPFA